MPEKFTDILTYALSLALAASVIAFAAYKVVKLNGMEILPPTSGSTFRLPSARSSCRMVRAIR